VAAISFLVFKSLTKEKKKEVEEDSMVMCCKKGKVEEKVI